MEKNIKIGITVFAVIISLFIFSGCNPKVDIIYEGINIEFVDIIEIPEEIGFEYNNYLVKTIITGQPSERYIAQDIIEVTSFYSDEGQQCIMVYGGDLKGLRKDLFIEDKVEFDFLINCFDSKTTEMKVILMDSSNSYLQSVADKLYISTKGSLSENELEKIKNIKFKKEEQEKNSILTTGDFSNIENRLLN